MRCRYCHNPELVRKVGFKSPDEVLNFLKKRATLLDGLVLSGGEATLYPGLGDFMRQAKTLGYAIKLDTNGLRPDRVKAFLEDGLLDYVALDYKAPPQKFKAVTGVEKFDFFTQTLDILCKQNKVDFEVRTTVHTDLLNEEDVNKIIHDLDERGYQGTYYVQNFRGDDDRPTLAMMPEQQQELDRSKLGQPAGFSLEYRNFSL